VGGGGGGVRGRVRGGLKERVGVRYKGKERRVVGGFGRERSGGGEV